MEILVYLKHPMLSQLEKGSNCKGASDEIKIVKETIAIELI